jgi:hypothetical protein
MTTPTPPTIPPAPSPAPTRADPANFRPRADAYHTWLVPFVNETLPAVIQWISDRTAQILGLANDVSAERLAAQEAANSSAASAAAAATSANAAPFVSGQAYTVGAVAYSPLTKSTYRRLTAGSGTLDPSADPVNWEPFGASIVALPGRTPLADAQGMLHPSWGAALRIDAPINDIGTPGTAGYGVGICPELPAGFTALSGTHDRLSPNFGNYLHSDGSTCVWIPAFYMRLAHADNPTFPAYGVNSIDTKALSAFPDEATANASGYYLHRAFVNAGANQLGFFRDKFDCTNNGGVASSIQNQQPMVSGPAAGQLGFSGATANGQTPANNYGGAVAAAKSRGNEWFPESIFMDDALTRLSEAHAQAATSTTHCAWWSAGTTNFPKGNNNNALRDTNDSSVLYVSAGNATHPAFALAGSATPFAKTTHNGQACGVADVNGNIYKINPGLTCVAITKTITGITQANPAQVTAAAHGFTTGQTVFVTGITGMTALNNRNYTITVVDENTVSLDGVNSTALPAWTSGGTIASGKFYALKPSVNIATLTGNASLSTDFWGAASIAANYDEVPVNIRTDYPNNASFQRFGDAANQVFGWGTATERLQSMLGTPAAGGFGSTGTALMGNDRYQVEYRTDICVISRGFWAGGSIAGVRDRLLDRTLGNANSSVGFAASRYL